MDWILLVFENHTFRNAAKRSFPYVKDDESLKMQILCSDSVQQTSEERHMNRTNKGVLTLEIFVRNVNNLGHTFNFEER